MTRGNQREINRERAQKRAANAPKDKPDHKDIVLRQMKDAEVLREKQKQVCVKAEEKKKAMELAAAPKPKLIKVKL